MSSTYEFSVVAGHDMAALDVAIRLNSSLVAAGFQGMTLRGQDALSAKLTVVFEEALGASEVVTLRDLVVRAGISVAVHRLWCVVCDQWYEIAADGRPVYCRACGAPFQAIYPRGQYIWSDPSQVLRRWAEIEVFVPFVTILAEPPRGGIELSDIVVKNTALPVVLEVRRDGFRCAIQVGVVSAMWQELSVSFAWKVVP